MFHEPKAKNDGKYSIKSGIDNFAALRYNFVVLKQNQYGIKKVPPKQD
jgi:hypothetical protein